MHPGWLSFRLAKRMHGGMPSTDGRGCSLSPQYPPSGRALCTIPVLGGQCGGGWERTSQATSPSGKWLSRLGLKWESARQVAQAPHPGVFHESIHAAASTLPHPRRSHLRVPPCPLTHTGRAGETGQSLSGSERERTKEQRQKSGREDPGPRKGL